MDEFLFASQLDASGAPLSTRMAPNTAFNFLLVGGSLLALHARRRLSVLSQSFAVTVSFGALLPISGYAYHSASTTGLIGFIPMRLPTAVTFLVLAAGLFLAAGNAPLSQVLKPTGWRGVVARQLFPPAAATSFVLGWLCFWGERHGLYDRVVGTALYGVILSLTLVLLWRSTSSNVAKLHGERAAMLARLRAMNRRKDEMIAVVSHDLCSPLTGFTIAIELLRERKGRDTGELLDLMDHSARRMVSMVRGLLDISKMEAEEMPLECEELLVSNVIRASMEPLAINAAAKQIALRFDSAAGEQSILADRLRLSQIFNNLLSNAVKFTTPGGSITVTLERASGEVRVTITDTGLGIAESDLPHLFDKYYQAGTKATGGEKGVGLGLAIVREVVQAHGGRIDVTSELHIGTTFTVYLPAAAPDNPTLFVEPAKLSSAVPSQLQPLLS